MNKFYKLVLSAIVVGFTFTSCTKDEEKSKGAFEGGIFISNEGAFNGSNASVSYIGTDEKVQQSIFKAVNGRDLGDVLQSITIADDKAYLVVNNSNKVEVVNANTFKEEGVITGLSSPRYLIEEAGKLYISQWNNTSVGVYDASTFSEIATITVGSGPEGLIAVNNEVWVANSGGWSTDNTISVIKTSDNTVSTIDLEGDNPKKMVEDSDGDIWVLCSGSAVYDWNPPYDLISQTPSKLVEIDASTKAIKKTIELSATVHYGHLEINDAENMLYYGGGFGVDGIFTLSTSDSSAPNEALISGYFYGFGVDGNDNVFGTLAPTFTENGSVVKYDSAGKEIATYEAGIGPNGVVLNN